MSPSLLPDPDDPAAEPELKIRGRVARLRAAKRLAGGLLLLTGILYCVSLALRGRPGADLLQAGSEAGLVGACADWFAVTALFRRPFNLPIPHTAIIPRNRRRIGRALGRFLVENFLDPEILQARLAAFGVARWGGLWLRRRRNARRLASWLAEALSGLVGSAPGPALARATAAGARALGRAAPASPLLAAFLRTAFAEGRRDAALDVAASFLARALAEREDLILRRVQEASWRWLPQFVDRAIARRVMDGLLAALEEARDPESAMRREVFDRLDAAIVRLETDPELQADVEAVKTRILEAPRLAAALSHLFKPVRARLLAASGPEREELARALETALMSLGRWIERDEALQSSLNLGARDLAARLILPRRRAAARFVEEVVEGWDVEDVVARLELQVGPDLQHIRVNGTLVGALVGLGLFAARRLLGLG